MSIELPEIVVISKQMKEVLFGKKIKECKIENYEKLQKSGFFNKNISDYNAIIDQKVNDISIVGIVIRIMLTNNSNLLLAPEMGGEFRYHTSFEDVPKKYHLLLLFSDNTAFTLRMKGYGLIYYSSDEKLKDVYVYKRDSEGLSPLDDDFTVSKFSKLLDERDQYIKLALVGKNAVVTGFGNAGFQEIAHQAKLHPKRRTSSLTNAERKALYKTIKKVVKQRIVKGGKFEFTDLYGKAGEYIPTVGTHLRDKPCLECGTKIERFQFAGGPTYFCPTCQPIE